MSATATKPDAYQIVTDRICAALEKGTAPWVRPWRTLGHKGTLRNATTNRPYHGINVWLLGSAGYADARWLTYRQAQALGGNVRKGERSTPAVFWKQLTVREKDDAGNETAKRIPFLRYYSLFNVEQCDGLKLADEQLPPEPTGEPNGEVQAFIEKTGADISHGGDRAYYSPATDSIRLPHVASFADRGAYYATALHELTHWTGHPSRTPRDLRNRFGSEEYAGEELVAELGSAFLCQRFLVNGTLQHPEYLATWLRALRNDKKAIITASSKARIAAEWLYAKTGTKAPEENESHDD